LPVELELAERLVAAGTAPALAERLGAYGALLLAATTRMNLTSARTVEALVPHLLDALTLVPFVRGPLVDIGSGAGLPGVPLGLATGHPVTLIEAVGKKAGFLQETLVALGLAGAVYNGRAETLGQDPALRGRFAAATARAVGSAPTVAELTVPFLAPGGLALLQRGRLETAEREATIDAAPMLGAVFLEERPLEGERRILILEKRTSTPARFPRRIGIPAKRPLCIP
jgi:16S rRNA (guanine527-N7)-methyltransferase